MQAVNIPVKPTHFVNINISFASQNLKQFAGLRLLIEK